MVAKNSDLCSTFESILLAFPSLHGVESGFSMCIIYLMAKHFVICGSNAQTSNLIFVIFSVPIKLILSH